MEYVSYKFIDIQGNLRDKVIRHKKAQFNIVTKDGQTYFDGSSFGFCPTEKSDLVLVPDPDSMHYDPIRKMPGVFCFLKEPGKTTYLENCFRAQTLQAENFDWQTKNALFGVEPEFFILNETEDHTLPKRLVPFGESGSWKEEDVTQFEYYGCLPPLDKTQQIRYEMAENLVKAGLHVESCHHEVAPGQAEISWKCDSLLKTADKLMLARYIIKATAVEFGAVASFNPKPFSNLNGNGCHTHQSVPLMKDEKNLLAYAQGLVDHYDDLVKVCNTHEDSHKRLVAGFEAPTKENNGYGWHDRTKTVRIPGTGGRVELRLPDAEMNPYLAFPKMLEFGYNSVMSVRKQG